MLNFIDNILNKVTMYRVVLYVLIFYFFASLLNSFLGFIPYTPVDLIISLTVILSVSFITNKLFSYAYDAPTNVESVYITALILFFIISPAQDGIYIDFLPVAIWAAVWAMASKYMLTIGRKHLFNPAAIGVVITSFTIGGAATWWVGAPSMVLFVALGGVMVARKLRHEADIAAYIITALLAIAVFAIGKGSPISDALILTVKNSAFLFFTFIMLTEPMTAPKTKHWRIIFSIIVGILSAPSLHIGQFYSTPELALVVGNIFAYIVSPKEKLFLKLKQTKKIGVDTYSFIFEKNIDMKFRAGQYMEWTLPHRSPDTRGNRRYFTIASSPTEDYIELGVKFYPEPSSFKNRLLALPVGGQIIASELSGDFVLPKNTNTELVFIAGGIGITPFRSMTKYLLDHNEKRNITLLYSCKTTEDIAYREVFDMASAELGMKNVYVVNDTTSKNLINYIKDIHYGKIDEQLIRKVVPNYFEKVFYISGPHGMVNAFESTLTAMGVPKRNIKIDFFPGFA